jgi:hypothetical protein
VLALWYFGTFHCPLLPLFLTPPLPLPLCPQRTTASAAVVFVSDAPLALVPVPAADDPECGNEAWVVRSPAGGRESKIMTSKGDLKEIAGQILHFEELLAQQRSASVDGAGGASTARGATSDML